MATPKWRNCADILKLFLHNFNCFKKSRTFRFETYTSHSFSLFFNSNTLNVSKVNFVRFATVWSKNLKCSSKAVREHHPFPGLCSDPWNINVYTAGKGTLWSGHQHVFKRSGESPPWTWCRWTHASFFQDHSHVGLARNGPRDAQGLDLGVSMMITKGSATKRWPFSVLMLLRKVPSTWHNP